MGSYWKDTNRSSLYNRLHFAMLRDNHDERLAYADFRKMQRLMSKRAGHHVGNKDVFVAMFRDLAQILNARVLLKEQYDVNTATKLLDNTNIATILDDTMPEQHTTLCAVYDLEDAQDSATHTLLDRMLANTGMSFKGTVTSLLCDWRVVKDIASVMDNEDLDDSECLEMIQAYIDRRSILSKIINYDE